LVGIVSWGSYIPKFRIKVEEIAKSQGRNAENIKRGLLINEKSVPGIDEDTATIIVEAARFCLKNHDPKKIGAIYIGSESHPYAVKPTGTIVAQAIGMGNNYTTADFEFACKAGTAAMQVSIGMVKSGMVEYSLAGAADTAQSRPGDALEYTAAAGGAVFLIGQDPVAIINDTVSYTSDTPDFWRKNKDKYPSHGGTFTGEPAYYKHIINATKLLMKKVNSSPKDYDYVIFHQPNGKFPRRVAKRLGFSKDQLQNSLLVDHIGNTYSGATLLSLAHILDNAKPGQRILLTSYGSGSGSDSFDITITDKINEIKKPKPVKSFIDNKEYIDYSKYLKLSGAIE
jgi:hydroxymethylglutaryl-CoA synthase